MIRTLAAFGACLTVLMMVGCSKGGDSTAAGGGSTATPSVPAANLIGNWKGELKMDEAAAKDPSAAMAASMMKNVTLELKSGNAYTMTMIFPIEGTWSQSGDTVNLKMTKMMGMSIEDLKKKAQADPAQASKAAEMDKPMTLKVSADGKTMEMQDTTGQAKGKMIFKKA